MKAPRGLDKALFHKLVGGNWIDRHHNLIVVGPTGVGKSWLACALGHKACRDNRSVLYQRVPRLFADLALARGDGRHARIMRSLNGAQLLILDDWGLDPLDGGAARRRHADRLAHRRVLVVVALARVVQVAAVDPAVVGAPGQRQLGLGVSRIVIDPGHGGHDPGAKGSGVTEASLVLDIALRLERNRWNGMVEPRVILRAFERAVGEPPRDRRATEGYDARQRGEVDDLVEKSR